MRLCWLHITHCWKSHVTAQLCLLTNNARTLKAQLLATNNNVVEQSDPMHMLIFPMLSYMTKEVWLESFPFRIVKLEKSGIRNVYFVVCNLRYKPNHSL